MNYKTYAEAKIANPDCEIVTTSNNWSRHYSGQRVGTFEKQGSHIIRENAWVICNPADYCSTLKEFLDAGFKLVAGDVVMTVNCSISIVKEDAVDSWNHHGVNDNGFFILSASVLNCGCKIPAKVEQWTIYNNTLPLSELSDDQAAKLFNAWRAGGVRLAENHHGFVELTSKHNVWISSIVYRIKQKSERDLFIAASVQLMTSETERTMEQMFGAQFDAGARYTDLTQHFGDNI